MDSEWSRTQAHGEGPDLEEEEGEEEVRARCSLEFTAESSRCLAFREWGLVVEGLAGALEAEGVDQPFRSSKEQPPPPYSWIASPPAASPPQDRRLGPLYHPDDAGFASRC